MDEFLVQTGPRKSQPVRRRLSAALITLRYTGWDNASGSRARTDTVFELAGNRHHDDHWRPSRACWHLVIFSTRTCWHCGSERFLQLIMTMIWGSSLFAPMNRNQFRRKNEEERVRTSGCAQGTVFGDIMESFENAKLTGKSAKLKTSWLYALTRKINTVPKPLPGGWSHTRLCVVRRRPAACVYGRCWTA